MEPRKALADLAKREPNVIFKRKDARTIFNELPKRIDILYYEKDSVGEGGSGVYILGNRWLSEFIAKFPDNGGLIITDGSNSGNGLFRDISKTSGYHPKPTNKWFGGYEFEPDSNHLLVQHGLTVIKVKRLARRSATRT